MMDTSHSKTQNESIIEYLREHGSISPKEALEQFGCMRLASRISELKKAGAVITSEMVTYLDADGNKRRYARYHLED